MAYENYSIVSWTDGSPITGERLQQMSTNIQQIKEATDDSPQGIKKIKSANASIGNLDTFATTTEIIALKDETGTNGPDYRVSIEANRYYRVTLNFPGFKVNAKGAEDIKYTVSIHSGIHGSANTTLYQADFTPNIFAFINVASAGSGATISNIALRSDSYPSRFGAGTYQVVATSSGGFNNTSYFAAVKRTQGASQTNAPSFTVEGALQLYVEDIGGTA